MNVNERLWVAVEAGNLARVKKALAAGADVNDEDEDGHTPLMAAAWRGDLKIVQLLVAAGADPNRWGQGDTPLNRAASGGHREVFNYLREIVSEETRKAVTEEELARGEKRRVREEDTVVEPFISAAMMGKMEQVEAGLAAGVDVDAIGSNGQTALHYAAFYGRMPVLERLLAANADVNVRSDEDGLGKAESTPLVLVASSFFAPNRPEVIQRLVDAGADLNARDNAGMTALMRAIEGARPFPDAVEALIAAGANLDIVNIQGNTALMYAVFRRRDELVTVLRDAGASEAGVANVLLCQGAYTGDISTVRQLLNDQAVNVNHVLISTPLSNACMNGHTEIVRLLIEAGANVSQPESQGYFTPLIRAAYGGHGEITRMLLEAGADIFAEIEGVGTALDYAMMARPAKKETKPWDEVIHLLEQANRTLK